MLSTSRRLFVYFGVVGALSLVPLSACLNPSLDEVEATERPAPLVESPALPPGTYPIQSIAYDDADGAYRVFLLDAPPSQRGAYVSTSLRMARLTDDEIAAGKSSFVDVDAEGPVAKLTPEFAIQYVHNVTEDTQNPRTGQTETVVVRQESSTWSPFMAGMTGAMLGNMLFSPMYHYPPPYRMGSPLYGVGGSGATRLDAQRSYQTSHGALPQPAKLSQSGYSKSKSSSSMKSTGSGAGSSRLNKGTGTSSRPRGGFGGGFRGGRRR